MKIKLLFILILLSSISLYAQGRGIIKGKIIDEDNLSLAGANIFITAAGIGTASNQDGEFILVNVPEGSHTLSVSYLGYQTQTIEIQVQSNKITRLDVVMKAGSVHSQEVVVLGERLKGQSKALNQQRSSENIINVISSEQIGRFPDANIGDALKRIPAINVYYDQGEARFANIRGTEPKLNSIMINGERIPSAEGETRAVQLDLVPSEMIQIIEVSKAILPEMDADAIGGAVNLITRSTPNVLRLSGTLGSGYNFLSEKPQYIGSFVVGQRFMDNKLGIVLSGSYHDHNLGSDNTEGTWAKDVNGKIYADEWEVREYQVRRLRQSISAAFDYEFNPTSKVNINAIYNHRNDWENRYRLRYRLLSAPDATGVVQKAEIRRQVKGGIDNDTNDNTRLEDQRTYSISLGGEHLIADVLKMYWSAAYAKASEERPNERYLQYRVRNVPVAVDLSNLEKPYFTPTNPSSVELSDYLFHELTEEYQYTDEKNLNLKLNFDLPLSSAGDYKNNLKFGVKYKLKDKKRDNKFFEYDPVSGYRNLSETIYADYTNNNFLAGNYRIGIFPTNKFIGSLKLKDKILFEESDVPAEYAAANYIANETVTAGYVQLNQQLGKNLLLIAGLRMENTSIEYTGNEFNDDTEAITPTKGEDSYTDLMPGVHFKYNLDENTVLRAAWTNTISRPDYYSLVPYKNVLVEDEELIIGNSALKPTRSTNLDLMGEKYFENIGIVSLGLFYKNIKDFIYVHVQDNYSYLGKDFKLFQPRNGGKAALFGFEASFQRQLDFLPSFLKNLGLYFNYTYTNSETDNPAYGGKKIDLPGTSPNTLNAALTYQDGAITLGLSLNYTDAYLDPEETDLTPGLERYYDKATYLDISGSYQFIQGFRFFFEANNLLNTPLRFYAGESKRTYQAEYYDRRISTGVKFDL
ncbi:MAG: TonB-dependent receptor [Bacteroidota bacterium]